MKVSFLVGLKVGSWDLDGADVRDGRSAIGWAVTRVVMMVVAAAGNWVVMKVLLRAVLMVQRKEF